MLSDREKVLGTTIGMTLGFIACLLHHLLPTSPSMFNYMLMTAIYGVGGYVLGSQYEKARAKCMIDPLTQVNNRAFYDMELARQLRIAERHGLPLSLVIVDLDHFKALNDALGHPAGDRVLKTLASHLEQQITRSDTVARYGGDEFVLILPNTPNAGAQSLMKRISREVGPGLADIPASFSYGIATFPDHAHDHHTLFKHADEALYAAKKAHGAVELTSDGLPD